MPNAADLAHDLAARFPGPGRRLVAIAGPPASGKSTMAAALVAALADAGRTAVLLPMDGFHLDNAVLRARGLLDRKGAPETFDAAGFLALIHRLRDGGEVVAPSFDRARDLSVAGAIVIPAEAEFVVAEGNYLLFDEPPWEALAPLWDASAWLSPPLETLRHRLVARWRDHGLDAEAAGRRVEANDLPNARRIAERRLPATIDAGP